MKGSMLVVTGVLVLGGCGQIAGPGAASLDAGGDVGWKDAVVGDAAGFDSGAAAADSSPANDGEDASDAADAGDAWYVTSCPPDCDTSASDPACGGNYLCDCYADAGDPMPANCKGAPITIPQPYVSALCCSW